MFQYKKNVIYDVIQEKIPITWDTYKYFSSTYTYHKRRCKNNVLHRSMR